MIEIAQRIQALDVPENCLGVIFMGQAGFILKSPRGQLLGIDLYLSRCCERYFGFKRLMPQLLQPGEVEFDFLAATHAHYDHFDVDSIPELLANSKTHLYMAADCVAECERLGIDPGKYTVLEKGIAVNAGEFQILPVRCDHGELAKEALGLYITCGTKSFYIAGDTCLREDIASEMSEFPISLAAAPINGAFGNMDSKDAAKFFSILRPECCVPCHYWNFAQHLGDPNEFLEEMKKQAPELPVMLLCPGEDICI